MKFSLFFTALAVSSAAAQQISGDDIKEKLRQFRDTKNVDKDQIFTFLNNRHEKRQNKLAELLAERKQQLADHEKGHRQLSTEDHARVTRQVTNFDRKLKQMENMGTEERRELMEHESESLYRMNAVEYLDFDLKKV